MKRHSQMKERSDPSRELMHARPERLTMLFESPGADVLDNRDRRLVVERRALWPGATICRIP